MHRMLLMYVHVRPAIRDETDIRVVEQITIRLEQLPRVRTMNGTISSIFF